MTVSKFYSFITLFMLLLVHCYFLYDFFYLFKTVCIRPYTWLVTRDWQSIIFFIYLYLFIFIHCNKYQLQFLNPRAIVGDYETLFYAIPNTQLVVFLFLYLCSFFKKSEGSVISMFIRTLVLSSSTLDDIM